MSSLAANASALQPEQWTSSSNEAVELFVTDDQGAIKFSPVFTYPIFGEAETIYGYKGLEIFLCFDHFTFYPFFNVKYEEKLNDPEIVDLKSTIEKFLPESAIFKDESKWGDAIAKEKENYRIPGELVDSFEQAVDDEVTSFDIYKLNLKDAGGLELHKRLQILVLLFIEAGSYIDASDELWDVYVLYKSTPGQDDPSIVGFTTVYNYWKYPGAAKFDKDEREVRLKISQFIILPIFQGRGIGGQFYSHLFEKWHKNDKVIEIVVEDPNESFDDLRDRSDLVRLSESLKLSDISTKITPEWIQNTRKSLKLEKRQFARLLELVLLYQSKNKLGSDSKKDIRLFIKKRIFEKNKEGLSALDENTKKDKLQTAYTSLEEDYFRILGDLKLVVKRQGADEENGSAKKIKV
ncbi:acyl-CoA N-acyltransferase [Scheffersomyces xylosifermentans]|uniref:acyl-CoA N-acyltransferase n=1 Tax=Scheffersomyces xylosifermentans TaxID=1304137 RepID=UPI00315D4791